MPKEYSRLTRIADLIRKELTVILHKEVADPRLRFITLTRVKVSRDLAFADIFFTQVDPAYLQGQQTTKAVIVTLLKKAASHLRYSLAQRLTLRVVPALRFFYDEAAIQSQRLHHLIDQAIAGWSE